MKADDPPPFVGVRLLRVVGRRFSLVTEYALEDPHDADSRVRAVWGSDDPTHERRARHGVTVDADGVALLNAERTDLQLELTPRCYRTSDGVFFLFALLVAFPPSDSPCAMPVKL